MTRLTGVRLGSRAHRWLRWPGVGGRRPGSRLSGAAALAAATLVAVSAGAASLAFPAPGPAAAAVTRAGGVPPTPSWRGELATVSGPTLTVTERDGRRRTKTLTAHLDAWRPTWSHDGRWLSFYELPSSPNSFTGDGPGTLWVSGARGGLGRVVGNVTASAWDPTSDVLAFVNGGQLELASMTGTAPKLTALRRFGQVESFAWSPSGRELAVGTIGRGTAAHPGALARLVVVPLDGAKAHVVADSRSFGFDVDSWWPDGRGVLYWEDEDFSGSIAADGLPLASRNFSTGRVVVLATTLPYPAWVAWSTTGDTVALVSGRDRIVWNAAKHIVICTVPDGRCRDVTQPHGSTSIDPAWGPGGRLYAFRSTGTTADTSDPTGIGDVAPAPPFSWPVVERWAAAGGIRSAVVVGGSSAPVATRAVTGAAGGEAPAPTSAGLFFVRAGALWRLGARSGTAERVTGRLGTFGSRDPGWYGYDDWSATFAWHR